MRIVRTVWLLALAMVATFGLASASMGEPRAMPSLCLAGEEPVLSCSVRGGKILSLCARGESLQYRFGRRGSLELAWPEQPAPAKGRFFFSVTGYAGGFEERIRFSNQGYDYVLFNCVIAGRWFSDGTRKRFEDAGVVIHRGGWFVGKQLCRSGWDSRRSSLKDQLSEEAFDHDLDTPCCGDR